jgi:hypothetical protein
VLFILNIYTVNLEKIAFPRLYLTPSIPPIQRRYVPLFLLFQDANERHIPSNLIYNSVSIKEILKTCC